MNEDERPASERRSVGANSETDAVHHMIPRTNAHAAGQRPADGSTITLPVGSSLFDVERAFIVATLEHCNGDKRRAARALGCSVKTLYNKLHLYRRQVDHDVAAG